MTVSAPTEQTRDEPERHSFRERLEAGIVRAAMGLLACLPLPWVSAVGSGFGWFLFRVVGFARRDALRNFDIAFGDTLTAAERWAFAGRCYRLYGALLCEFLSLPRLKGERLWRHMTFENADVLASALASGRGAVLVTGHYGSWELVGACLVASGFPTTVYTGGQRNTLVDDQINAIRSGTGETPVGRRNGGVRGLLRALRAGQVTALIADQHESTKRHYVSFFGQPVSIAAGPYRLARRSGAPVVYFHSVREGRFRYRATFEALPGARPNAEEERDLLEFGQRMIALLERDTRAHPDHYFWMHRRFRPIPAEVTLSEVNRAFLAGRLRGPVDSFWEQASAEPAAGRAPGRGRVGAG